MTPEQRARLAYVLADATLGPNQMHSEARRQAQVVMMYRAIAAAERAGFRIEGPASG